MDKSMDMERYIDEVEAVLLECRRRKKRYLESQILNDLLPRIDHPRAKALILRFREPERRSQ